MAIDFKAATDTLFAKVGPEELAAELEGSPNAIRQARMDPAKDGHRSPPPGWEAAVARLARQRAAALVKLAERLT
jgi:hypothetical protein